MKTLSISIVALALLLSNAYSDQPSSQVPSEGGQQEPTAAKPDRETKSSTSSDSGVNLLFRFEGKWKIDEDYPARDSQPASKGRGDATYNKELGNLYIIGEYHSRNKDLNMAVEGHAVITYDQNLEHYRYWWFNNYNSGQEYSGKFESSSNTLIFTPVASEDQDSSDLPCHKFKFEGNDKIIFTILKNAEGSNPITLVTVTMERKGSGTKPQQPEEKRGESSPPPAPRRGM